MTIQQMLEHVESLKIKRDLAMSDHKTRRDAIIPAELRLQLAMLDDEHDAEMEEIDQTIADAEAQLKAAVAEVGETIKGQHYQAVYAKPRVSWDTKRLEQYAKANDLGILDFRTEGAPSVSIRPVKKH